MDKLLFDIAPDVKRHGGGASIEMLLILVRVSLRAYGSLCASVRPAVGLLMMRGTRSECAKRHALVIAAMPGAVDADMERDFEGL